MNKKIERLIEKATTVIYSGPGEIEEFDKEKFAKLLVRECISIIDKSKDEAIDNRWNVDNAMSVAEMNLLEHFGIKTKS